MGKNKTGKRVPFSQVLAQTKGAKRVPPEATTLLAGGSYREKRPLWQFRSADLTGSEWCWRTRTTETHLENILERLRSFETMTWHEILSKKDGSHAISPDQVCPEAQKRLADLRLDIVDELI